MLVSSMETCEFEGNGELGEVDILSRPKRPSVLAQQWERHCVEHAIFIVCDPTLQQQDSPAAQDEQRDNIRADAMLSCTDSPRFQPEDSTCTSPVCINTPPAEDNNSKMPPTRVMSTPLFGTNGVSPNFSAESIYEAEFFEGSPLTSYTELSEQLTQQTEKVRQLELRLSECERNNANLSLEIERLNTSLEQAEKNEGELSRSAVQSEQEALEARKERDELQESLMKNEDALANTKALMRQLQDELETVKRELQEYEAKVQEMDDKLDEAHKQVVAAQTLAETLRQEVETHKKDGEGQSEQLEFTAEQLNEFKRINLDLSSELDYMSEEYRRVSNVNDNLKRQLSIFVAPTTTSVNIDSSDEPCSSLLSVSAMFSMEPTSLGEEIQALKDRGALPIGVETSDSERNSTVDFVLQMMEERYNMAERQVHELAPRLELDPRVFAENENRRQIVINHIAAVQAVEETLSELLQKLFASDVSDGGDESHRNDEASCIVVLKLVHMQNELRRATESLSERMGGLELQLTQSVEPTCNGDGAVAVPSVTPGPGSSVADGSQQHGDGERACSEASWGRSTIGGGSGVNTLHPAPLRDVSIEGSDAISCAGSQLERDTCTHVTPERIKCQVHRELAALQSQINKSLEVLAALARSSDLLSVLKEYPISEQNQPDAVSATSGMEEHRGTEGSAADSLHPTSGMGATGHQLAKSCPTLATQLSAATQTENEQIDIPPQRMVGSTGDVKEFDEPSPKRFRSSSFVAAIEAGDTPVVLEEPEDGEEELEDEVLQVEVTNLSAEFMNTVAEFDNSHELLDEFSARVVEEHPCSGIDGATTPTLPASPEHPEEDNQLSSSPPNDEASPESEQHSTSQQNPRLSRQRGSLTGAISSAIQRSAAVDLDENEETTPSAQQAAVVVSPGGSKRGSTVAFPSIPDAVLKQMGLHRDSAASPESLTEHDVENKFTQLSLAFKTDKLTLDHRVNIQQRQRDDAERNVAREITELRNKVNRLKRLCQESETIEELSEVQHQVEVLAQSSESVSRSAELYGAVQQEERVSRAVDVILAHVENLRRVQAKERTELEETRRLLQEAASDTGDDLTSGRGGVRLRTQQLQDSSRVRQPVRALQESSVRRTSFGSQSQRPESMSGSIDETLRARRSDLTLEAQLMQSEVDQSSEGSVTGVVTGINHLDSLLHDEEVALSASLADHLDLSGSEDELQHELNWRDSELRQRRSQSGQGAVLSQTAGRLPTARSLSSAVRSSWRWVRSMHWPWSKEQSIWMLRRGATTVLLALAALTILFVLLPVSAAVVTGSRLCSWNPLRIEMPPGYGFQGHRRPPPV